MALQIYAVVFPSVLFCKPAQGFKILFLRGNFLHCPGHLLPARPEKPNQFSQFFLRPKRRGLTTIFFLFFAPAGRPPLLTIIFVPVGFSFLRASLSILFHVFVMRQITIIQSRPADAEQLCYFRTRKTPTTQGCDDLRDEGLCYVNC